MPENPRERHVVKLATREPSADRLGEQPENSAKQDRMGLLKVQEGSLQSSLPFFPLFLDSLLYLDLPNFRIVRSTLIKRIMLCTLIMFMVLSIVQSIITQVASNDQTEEASLQGLNRNQKYAGLEVLEAPTSILELEVLKPEVKRLEVQPISARFICNGTPVPEASVIFQITYPNGEVFTWVKETDGEGEATLSFRVPPDAPAPGTYWVYASAYKPGVPNATAIPESFYVPLFIFDLVALNDTSIVRVSETLKVTALIRASWNLTQTSDEAVLHLYHSGGNGYSVPMTFNPLTGLWEAVWTPSMLDPTGNWNLHVTATDAYGNSQNSSIYNFTVTNCMPTIRSVHIEGLPVPPNGTFTAYIGENLTLTADIQDLDATPEELNVTLWRVSGPTLLMVMSYNPTTGLWEGWVVAAENMTLMVQVENGYGGIDRWFVSIQAVNNPPVIHWVRAIPSTLTALGTVLIEALATDYEDGIPVSLNVTVTMPNGTMIIRPMFYNVTLGYFQTNFTVLEDYPVGTYLLNFLAVDSQGATARNVTSFYYMVSAPTLSDPKVNDTVQYKWTLTVGETLTFTVNVTDYDTAPEDIDAEVVFAAPNGSEYTFTMSILTRYSDVEARYTYTYTAKRGYILPSGQAWTVYLRAEDPKGNFAVLLVASVAVINTPPEIAEPVTFGPIVVYRVVGSITVEAAITDLEDGANLASVTITFTSPSGLTYTYPMIYDEARGVWTITWTPNATADASPYYFWSFQINATDTHGLYDVSSRYLFVVMNNVPMIVSAIVTADGVAYPLEIFRVNETLTVEVVVYDVEAMAISDPEDIKVFLTATSTSSPTCQFVEELQYDETLPEGFRFMLAKTLNWTVPVGNYILTITVRDSRVLSPPQYEESPPYNYPFRLRVLNARPEVEPITMNGALYALYPKINITIDIAVAVHDHETPPENMTVFCMVKWMNGTAGSVPPYIIMDNGSMTYEADGRFHRYFNLTTEMPEGAYLIVVTALDRDAVEFLSPRGIAFRANHFDYVTPSLGVTEMKVETYGVGRGNQTVSISAAVYYWNGLAWVPLNATYAEEMGWSVTASMIPSWNVAIDPVYSMHYNETTKRWETGPIIIARNMTVGEYFAMVTGGGVPSNETAVFEVTNAKPLIPAYEVVERTYRLEALNITAAIIDSDNHPNQLKAFFLGWEPGKRPFFDPPTINISLAYTGYNYTTITFEFAGLEALPREIPAGNYTCAVVAWDPAMAGYPDEYSASVNMTLTILNRLPSFWAGPIIRGVSIIRDTYIIRENGTLMLEGWVIDVEDGYDLNINITVTGSEGFRYTKALTSSMLSGYFAYSLRMLPTYLSGNYTLRVEVTDKDLGSTVWTGWIALNRPASIIDPRPSKDRVYRVTETLVVSANIVNDLPWETADLITVYLNLRDPAGVWTNETLTMTYNGTHFVWAYSFPKESSTGIYTAVIKVIDLYEEVSLSTPLTFEVLNNPPVVTAIAIEDRSIAVGEAIVGWINASDVEGISEVKVCFKIGEEWINITTTYQEGLYRFNIDTEGWAGDTYNVYAVAVDIDGAVYTLDGGTVTLTAPPVIPITWIVIGVVAVIVVIVVIRARRSPVIIED